MRKLLLHPLFFLSLFMMPLAAVEIATQFDFRRHQEKEVHEDALRLLSNVEVEQQRLIDDV